MLLRHLTWITVLVVTCSWYTSTLAENPCCSFPCQNRGVCITGKTPGTYSCDCSNLDFYGKHCETPYFFKRLKLVLKPSASSTHALLVRPGFKWLWTIVNNVQFIHDVFMRIIYTIRSDVIDSPPLYETVHAYPTVSATTNDSLFARTLPPVPDNCPTPMGVAGKEKLPDPQLLIDRFFSRKQFRPDPLGSSILFTYFAQHFSHMFFKTDVKRGPGFTWGGPGVDVTSIYGTTVADEHLLRSMKDGKFKMQSLNGEEYPMYQKDVPINMTYLPHVPQESRFAMGHPFYGLLPGLFLYQTIWMREHNRVCDVMKSEHPDWDDEQLFQTSKLILVGETIKIVIEDYVQHLSNYNIQLRFRPSVLFGHSFQYQNKINVEFNHLYHWHPLMPDEFQVGADTYGLKDYMFHAELVVKYGTAQFTEALSRQRAGQMSHHNHGQATQHVLRDAILHGRTLRFQSLNNYRRRFNLPPYTSFQDLTGEKAMAAELETMYGDIEAMEFYVGLLVEKRRERILFGETIVEIGGPYSVKGLLSNPVCSPFYWRPSTFGGDVGFDIVQTATLENLFCNNIPGKCPLVSFRVPDYKEGDVDDLNNYDARLKDEL